MKKALFLFAILIYGLTSNAQNLFPIKLDNCVTDRFCLDCGDKKADIDQQKFSVLANEMKTSGIINGVSGKVTFQVLVDSLGQGCVLSHNDGSNSEIGKQIIKKLNAFNGWIPAKTDGKIEGKVSINVEIAIQAGTMTGTVARVDMDAFEKSFDHPNDPEIFNEKYTYKNQNLKKYKIKVWNSENSELPNNQADHVAIAKNNVIWFTVDEGLYRLDNGKLINSEQNIADKGDYFGYHALEVDNYNTVWIYGGKGIFSFNSGKWTFHDEQTAGTDGAYDIVNDAKNNTVLFCTEEGLFKYRNGWDKKVINKVTYPELPEKRVYFAQSDSKGRLWMGTFSGTAMIDDKGKFTNFEKEDTVLKGQCITSMAEDEKGNLYFGLYKFGDSNGEVNRNEGIAILDTKGKWKQYTTDNSGMPFNHTSDVLYDKKEKVLWIATDRAGLVRFDLKDGWENYHNLNSDIPTSYISDLEQDSEGNIWIGTRQGLVKLERK